jgi:prevent-host-death family protein
MRIISLFEAKQKLSELVDLAAKGERIGITRRGKLTAFIVPVQPKRSLRESFAELEKIRKKVRMPSGITVKSTIEEGRR